MIAPRPSPGKNSEQVLAEALRARAGGTPGLGARSPHRPAAAGPVLTLLQLVLAAAIGGMVIGILIAVVTLI